MLEKSVSIILNEKEYQTYIKHLYESGQPPYLEDGSINPVYLRFDFEFQLCTKDGQMIQARASC